MTQPVDSKLSIPFLERLGVVRHIRDDGRSEIALDLETWHHNSWEMAHGGVVMTLLDVAMAVAARSGDPEERGVVTIEMKTSFMAPGRGSKLVAIGDCLQRTSTMAFCEAEIRGDDGKLAARASGTFKFIKRKPAHRRPADGEADTGADG